MTRRLFNAVRHYQFINTMKALCRDIENAEFDAQRDRYAEMDEMVYRHDYKSPEHYPPHLRTVIRLLLTPRDKTKWLADPKFLETAPNQLRSKFLANRRKIIRERIAAERKLKIMYLRQEIDALWELKDFALECYDKCVNCEPPTSSLIQLAFEDFIRHDRKYNSVVLQLIHGNF